MMYVITTKQISFPNLNHHFFFIIEALTRTFMLRKYKLMMILAQLLYAIEGIFNKVRLSLVDVYSMFYVNQAIGAQKDTRHCCARVDIAQPDPASARSHRNN